METAIITFPSFTEDLKTRIFTENSISLIYCDKQPAVDPLNQQCAGSKTLTTDGNRKIIIIRGLH